MYFIFKRIVSRFPQSIQQELKRWNFWRLIRTGHFKTDEPEYKILNELVSNGDWVIDIGANVGHYTAKLSKLVGPKGRVIAIEPVPETFDILASNSRRFEYKNVTLLNVAISDRSICRSVEIPKFKTGLKNFYQAHISKNENAELNVFCIELDSLCIPHKVRLIKIDTENHEHSVLNGSKNLINRDKPTLIIESNTSDVDGMLHKMGYSVKRLKDSPNKLFQFLSITAN